MRIGRLLLEAKGRYRLSEVAERLEVDPRTLRNWRERAKMGSSPRLGRPAYSADLRRRASWQVARELRRQGQPGWRPVLEALRGQVPTRLVQELVRELKARRRKRERNRARRLRKTSTILVANAVWAQDGTHLGRAESRPIEAQVIRDRASRKTIAWSAGPPASHREVIALMELSKRDRGLPLVWMTDNGSNYTEQNVAAYLRANQVVHLRSLPRTPQHNAGVEIAMREHKGMSGLGRGTNHKSVESVIAPWLRSTRVLNQNRLRARLGFKTADQIDDRTDVHYNESIRARFYKSCCESIQAARLSTDSDRARRSAEREAILVTMEKFGLMKRQRDGQSTQRNAEIFL